MSTSYEVTPPPDEAIVSTPDFRRAAVPRVSWRAIFAGLVLVIAIEVLLDILGAGIGLGVVNPNGPGGPGVANLGLAAGLWWFVMTLVALLVSSYATARLAGVSRRFDGALHGFVIWGLSLIIALYVMSTAVGGVVGGVVSALGSVVSTVGSGVQQVVPQVVNASGVKPPNLQNEAKAFLQQPANANPNPATMSPEDATKAIAAALPDLAAGGDKAKAAKQRIVAIMAAQLKISQDDAEKRFDAAEAHLRQARDQAVQAARHAAAVSAAGASRASLVMFGALLIGAIAAGIGGALASPRPNLVSRRPVV